MPDYSGISFKDELSPDYKPKPFGGVDFSKELSPDYGLDPAEAKPQATASQPTTPPGRGLAGLAKPYQPGSTSLTQRVGDIGVSAGKGIVGVGEAGIGALDLLSSGKAGKDAESLGVDFKRTQGILDSLYSPAQQAANAEVSNAQGFLPTLGAVAQNPSVIAQKTVESLPLMAGGLAIGKGAQLLAPKISPLLAGAIGEGGITTASSAESTRQQSPDGLLTPKQLALSVASGGLTGAITGGMGVAANKLGLPDINQMFLGGNQGSGLYGRAARTALGGLTEGAQETAQSGQEQALSNLALDKPLSEGVGQAAALGAVTGAAMGGGLSALSTPNQRDLPRPTSRINLLNDRTRGVPVDFGGKTMADVPAQTVTATGAPLDGVDPNAGALSRAAYAGSRTVTPEFNQDFADFESRYADILNDTDEQGTPNDTNQPGFGDVAIGDQATGTGNDLGEIGNQGSGAGTGSAQQPEITPIGGTNDQERVNGTTTSLTETNRPVDGVGVVDEGIPAQPGAGLQPGGSGIGGAGGILGRVPEQREDQAGQGDNLRDTAGVLPDALDQTVSQTRNPVLTTKQSDFIASGLDEFKAKNPGAKPIELQGARLKLKASYEKEIGFAKEAEANGIPYATKEIEIKPAKPYKRPSIKVTDELQQAIIKLGGLNRDAAFKVGNFSDYGSKKQLFHNKPHGTTLDGMATLLASDDAGWGITNESDLKNKLTESLNGYPVHTPAGTQKQFEAMAKLHDEGLRDQEAWAASFIEQEDTQPDINAYGLNNFDDYLDDTPGDDYVDDIPGDFSDPRAKATTQEQPDTRAEAQGNDVPKAEGFTGIEGLLNIQNYAGSNKREAKQPSFEQVDMLAQTPEAKAQLANDQGIADLKAKKGAAINPSKPSGGTMFDQPDINGQVDATDLIKQQSSENPSENAKNKGKDDKSSENSLVNAGKLHGTLSDVSQDKAKNKAKPEDAIAINRDNRTPEHNQRVQDMKDKLNFDSQAKKRADFTDKHKGLPFAQSLINNDHEKAIDDIERGYISKESAREIFDDAKNSGLLNDRTVSKISGSINNAGKDIIQTDYVPEIETASEAKAEPSAETAKDTDSSEGSNQPSVKFSKSAKSNKDQEYLDAVKNGDMVTAQKLVDEMAKEAGYGLSDYQMNHEAPDSNTGYSISDLTVIYPDDIYSSMATRYYGDGQPYDSQAMSALQRAKGKKPTSTFFVYRAVPKNSKEEIPRNGDWVTPTRQYAKEHGEAHLPEGYKIIAYPAMIKNIYTDGNSIHELGYDDGKNYAYSNTKNNRKLLDAVTYDDNGDVIPLSMRFKKRNDDSRYSKSQATKGSTVAEIAASLGKQFGTKLISRLLEMGAQGKRGGLVISDKPSPSINGEFNESTGISTIYAKSVNSESAPGVLLHEIGVHAMKLGKSMPEYALLKKQALTQANVNPQIGQALKAALRSFELDAMPKKGEKIYDDVLDELLAYTVEMSPNTSMAKRIIAWVKNAIRQLGKLYDPLTRMELFKWAGKLTPDDLVVMAHAGLRLAAKSNYSEIPNSSRTMASAKAERFYSALRRAFVNAPEKVFGSGKQVAAWLQGNKSNLGVKDDEIYFSGITDYLNMVGKVSRQDVLSYLKESGVQVQDVTLSKGDWAVSDGEGNQYFPTRREAEQYAREQGISINEDTVYRGTNRSGGYGSKYAQYTVPGGENYQELLLTLPVKSQYPKEITQLPGGFTIEIRRRPTDIKSPNEHSVFRNGERYSQWWDSKDKAVKQALKLLNQEVSEKYADENNTYKSSHFDQPNIVAHTRFDERTDADGNKTLFVQEIQSDWGQEGKKKGFAKNRSERIEDLKSLGWELQKISPNEWQIIKPYHNSNIKPSTSQDGAWDNLLADNRHTDTVTNRTLRAPFVQDTKSWVALAIKKLISHAVDNNIGKIAFINGEQAADLYDLRKQVQAIQLTDKNLLYIKPINGSSFENIGGKPIENDKLSDYIGKDAAQKLIDSTPDKNGDRTIKGDDLKVGGKGMATFYNEIVPSVAREITRRMGGEVGTLKLNSGKQQSLTITPTMKAKVLNEGMSLFSKKAIGETAPLSYENAEKHVEKVINNIFGKKNDYREINLENVENTIELYRYLPSLAKQYGYTISLDFANGGSNYLRLTSKAKDNYGNPFDIVDIRVADHAYGHRFNNDTDLDYDPKIQNSHWIRTILVPRLESSNGSIKYSKAQPNNGTTLPGPSRKDDWIYINQDRFIRLKRKMQGVVKNGGAIREADDPYMSEELYHQRSAYRIKQFYEQEMNPILQGLHRAGVTYSAFQKFLHARHAQERNKPMAAINPNQAMINKAMLEARAELKRTQSGTSNRKMIDKAQEELDRWERAKPFKGTEAERLSLSGMSDTDAKALIDGLTPKERTAMNLYGDKIDAITKKTLDTMAEYGLETADFVENLKRQYDHYAPMYRDDAHPDDLTHPIGMGFSVRGSGLKSAVGSNAEVTNIIAHVAQQREQMIKRGEKNIVTLKLANFLASHPDPDFAEIGRVPTYRTTVNDLVETLPDPLYTQRENVVMFRVKGKDIGIVFNEKNPDNVRIAESFKNMDGQQLNAVEKIVNPGTRWIASVSTQYNLVWGVFNFLKDVQGSLVNLTSTPLRGKQVQVFKNLGHSIAVIAATERGWSGIDPKYRDYFESFNKNGGTTGFSQMFNDIKDRSKSLETEMNKEGAIAPIKAARAALKVIEDFNVLSENAVRLATYITGIENGLSEAKSASIAKNISVNFNRKGARTIHYNVFFAFFNASFQANARTLETLAGPAGKKIIVAGVGMGIASTMIGIAMMGADDWDKIPEWDKERNLIIPALGTESGYIKLPLPLGLNMLPNIGRIMVELAIGSNRKSATQRLVGLMGSIASTASPINGSDLASIITPTVADIPISLARNTDYTGRSIEQEDFNSLDPTPGHSRAKDTATLPSKWLSYGINWTLGGTEYKPSPIWSPTPDAIDYVFGSLLGGTGKELARVGKAIETKAKGGELPPHKWPIVGKLYGETKGDAPEKAMFYDTIKVLNQHWNEIDGLRRKQKFSEAADYMAKNPEAKLYQQAKAAFTAVGNLKKRMELLEEQGKDTKTVRNLITARMKAVNDRYLEAIK